MNTALCQYLKVWNTKTNYALEEQYKIPERKAKTEVS